MTAEATGSSISSISGHNAGHSTSGANGGASVKPLPIRKNPLQALKTDEIEVQVVDQSNPTSQPQKPSKPKSKSGRFFSWLCCGPCLWLKSSTAVHRMALTAATLVVTSLLVASPIIFLISAAPHSHPRDCMAKDDDDCLGTPAPPPECQDQLCRLAAASIQSRINWKMEPCKDFKSFSCSSSLQQNSLRVVKSAQEIADYQMQRLLSLNTSSGPFRKLGRLYESCLRESLNSTRIRVAIEKLGGYLPITALGPSTISLLVTQIHEMGAPLPLIDIYYDLSYGRKPQVLLIIDGPMDASQLLENPVRWLTPKSPPFAVDEDTPVLLDDLLKYFLPKGLSTDQKESERQLIYRFIRDLNQIRKEYLPKDFTNSYVVNNVSSLTESYPFMNWAELLPSNWTGPIVVRSSRYLESLRLLLQAHSTRVIHNSLLLLFTLSALPAGHPTQLICTKATMSHMPEASSALFVAQHSDDIKNSIYRAEAIFESIKAHLKRAPSLRGAALVRLSSLKIQAKPWPTLFNTSEALKKLNELEITSDSWFENVLNIYRQRKQITISGNISAASQTSWAYPTIAKVFYDPLSHSIVVPSSVMQVPYFNDALPPYLHYATVGTALAKEILRSVTKAFEDKAMNCVPATVDIFSNTSRMDLLIYSGGLQMAYHSLLALTGPIKGMDRLPGLNMTPMQLFFLVTAQELCAESEYNGVDINSADFHDILSWLINQGSSASAAFRCHHNTHMRNQKNCDIW